MKHLQLAQQRESVKTCNLDYSICMFVTLYSHKTIQNESLKINESTFIFKEKVKKKKIIPNNLVWLNRLIGGGKPKCLHTQ